MTIVLSLVSVAAELVSQLLYKRPQQPWFGPTTLAQRGAYIPYVLGNARVTPVPLWAGNRETSNITSGKGGFSQTTGQNYTESAWHGICVGPASRLFGIIQSGATYIFYTDLAVPITPATAPSGSVFEAFDGSSFAIYWGEPDQPINADLNAYIGINSQWPNMCYILWFNKKLGTSPVWPDLKYDIQCIPPQSADPLVGTDYYMPSTYGTAPNGFPYQNDGVNPAHALYQILTAPYPNGIGLPASRVDAGSLEAIADFLVSEQFPTNLYAENGTDAATAIGSILSDAQLLLPQVADKLVGVGVRQVAPNDVVNLTSGMMSTPLVETTRQLGTFFPNRRIYQYLDRQQNYASMDLVQDNDANMAASQNSRATNIDMKTVVDFWSAQNCIFRREKEFAAQTETYKFGVMRGGRLLIPGQTANVPGIGQVRVASIKLATDTTKAEVEAINDIFINPTAYTYDQLNLSLNSTEPLQALPEADVDVKIFQYPSSVVGSAKAIGVLRIRGGSDVVGSQIFGSDTGSSYAQIGEQDTAAAGGTLQSGITSGAGTGSPLVIATGPVLTAINDDIANLPNLTGQTSLWQGGDLLCFIVSSGGTECFFVQSVTAVTGGWQLNNMIRGQYGTTPIAHAIGDLAYIIPAANLEIIESSMVYSGATLYVKSDPFNLLQAVALSTITPVTLTIT